MRLALSIISVLLLSEVQFFVQCTNKYCNQGKNCRIEKDCFCASRSYPLPLKDTPQFIYFGFDDAVTKLLQMDVYDYIFQSGRKNPNGCPISFSLYVSHNYTDYSLVRRYYNLGLEIGSHSVTHTRLSNKTDLEREARKQKDNLVRLAGVDKSDIRGWRSPFLQTAGDWQPYVLKKLGYEYDISMSIARLSIDDDKIFWPLTLDFSWPFLCTVGPCPRHAHPGFWQVPIIPYFYHDLQCSYVDACRPDSETATYSYFWDNFVQFYNGTRVPFGFNMHASFFVRRPDRLRALFKFIDDVLALKDVYIVSTSKVIDWMKNPVQLQRIDQNGVLGCSAAVKQAIDLASAQMTSRINELKKSVTKKSLTTITTMVPEITTNITFCKTICALPKCLCRSSDIPGSVLPSQTVKLVYFTFEGSLSADHLIKYKKIFYTGQTNPDGCSLGFTLFLTGKSPYARQLEQYGAEIALHGTSFKAFSNHTDMKNDLINQLRYFREIGVKVKGWRSPGKPTLLGDNQFKILKALGIEYDSSINTASEEGVFWPHTLDDPWRSHCMKRQGSCPRRRHPGIWEVPIVSVKGGKNRYDCMYVDTCFFNPTTAQQTFQMLKANFLKHYEESRSPFGINIKNWLHSHYQANYNGLIAFVNWLNKQENTYIISIEKVLEWIKHPVSASALKNRKLC